MSSIQSTLADAPDGIDDHRPAAKLVYLVLTVDGPLTGKELSEATRLPGGTIRQEARRLRDDNLVQTRPRADGDARGLEYDAV